jgi:hypothetical protein
MLKPSFLFCLFYSCAIAKAQRNESPATLISTHNDTLKVWVSFKEFTGNLHSIRIKRDSLDKKTENWPASAVRSLSVVHGPYYIGAAVLIDKTPADKEVSERFDSSSISLAKDTVLLNAEFIGDKITLLSLVDRNKSHFFVQKSGGQVTELFDRKYRLRRGDILVEAEDKSYIHQLEQFMEDCPDVANNLLDIPYTVDALKKIAGAYNSCGQKGQTLYESETKKGRLQIALLSGIGLSAISEHSYNTPTIRFNSKTTFAGGVSFDYFLSKTDKKFSIVGSILYDHTHGSESVYSASLIPSDYTLETQSIDYAALHVDLLCRYTVPLKGDFRPFIDGGLAFFGALSKQNTDVVDEYYDNAHHVTDYDLFAGGFRSFQVGLEAGAGLRYKRFGLEYKFQSISNISNYSGVSFRVNSQQIMLLFNLRN